MDKLILKMAMRVNPEIPFSDYREALTSKKLDESVVNQIYNSIIPSPKKYNSEILFAACVLLIFSPRSILLDEKVENGVCDVIKRYLMINQQCASYRVRVAREVYEVDKVFKQQVDDLVKEVDV